MYIKALKLCKSTEHWETSASSRSYNIEMKYQGCCNTTVNPESPYTSMQIGSIFP